MIDSNRLPKMGAIRAGFHPALSVQVPMISDINIVGIDANKVTPRSM